MDSRKISTLPIYMLYCGAVTCLNSLSIGYVIGSPNIPEESIRGLNGACGSNPYSIQEGFPNCFEFSDLIWGFAVGSYCLGACAGGLIAGSIQSKVGRIKTMMLCDIFFILGSLILGLTYHQSQFIIGRIVVGFGCGIGFVVVPTYLGEIATLQGRGTLGALHQLFLVFGLLISNLVGIAWSSPPGWRIVFVVNAVPNILQLFLLRSLVESPKFLVSKGRKTEAHDALQKLRGLYPDIDITQEFSDMTRFQEGDLVGVNIEKREEVAADSCAQESDRINPVIDRGDSSATVVTASTIVKAPKVGGRKVNNQEPYGIIELFTSEYRGHALIGAFLHFLQQASGVNGLVYYSTSFLTKVFGSENSRYLTVGISFCSLISTAVSVFLINRFNRKTLLIASFAGLSFSCILLVVGSYANIGMLVAISVFLYFAAFALAIGPMPWLLVPELLPSYAASSGSSVATFVNNGTNFLVGLVFPSMAKGMGNATFILFTSFNIFGIFFTWYFLPETKDRSIDDILKEKGITPRSRGEK